MISLLKEELEPKQEEKLEVKEASEQEKLEICFSKNYIYAVNQKNYSIQLYLEREKEIISLNSYKEGDILYQLKYNMKKNTFRVYVYKIILNNKEYKVTYTPASTTGTGDAATTAPATLEIDEVTQ